MLRRIFYLYQKTVISFSYFYFISLIFVALSSCQLLLAESKKIKAHKTETNMIQRQRMTKCIMACSLGEKGIIIYRIIILYNKKGLLYIQLLFYIRRVITKTEARHLGTD